MAFSIELYTEQLEEKWDLFIKKSMNGTFLQTRRFLNYHKKGKFIDCSLLVKKGQEIVGVIPGCEIINNNQKVFFSHQGSTFGGLILSNKIYSTSNIQEIFILLENYLKQEGFNKVFFKMTPSIYQKEDSCLLDYFFYQRNYNEYHELNYYLDLSKYKDNILSQFSSSKRRDYRYSLKHDLYFSRLETESEIQMFYDVLQLNLKKLGLNSVHSFEDLIDLRFKRFNKNVDFYGVFKDKQMIAGTMLFYFSDDIVHTQYLSSDEEYLKMFPMDFLIFNIIETAIKNKKKILTFGICTENKGKYLNFGLSRFKEGFGTNYCFNNSYEKTLDTGC